jgi:hypothetical protein
MQKSPKIKRLLKGIENQGLSVVGIAYRDKQIIIRLITTPNDFEEYGCIPNKYLTRIILHKLMKTITIRVAIAAPRIP